MQKQMPCGRAHDQNHGCPSFQLMKELTAAAKAGETCVEKEREKMPASWWPQQFPGQLLGFSHLLGTWAS